MRTLLRTALVTMLVMFSILIAWSFIRSPNSAESAKAASRLPVPSYCVEPALAGIQEALAKTTNPSQLLLGKKKALEQAELDCAANATAHPPAQKPNNFVGVLQPTSIPATAPGPTLQFGIQHGDVGPAGGDFIPVPDGNNVWYGYVNSQIVVGVAGFIKDVDQNLLQEHPEWQAHPELHVQGGLEVTMNYDTPNHKLSEYPTPSRNGAVHFINACGNLLVLQATDNTIFTFDVSTMTYVNNSSTCLVPTP